MSWRRLLRALPRYRNRVLGHGGIREDAFYEGSATVLLSALEASWEEELFLPSGAELVYVESVVGSEADGREGRVLLLQGTVSTVADAQGTSDLPADVEAGGTYLRLAGRWQDLRPWLSYEADERGERVLFFNGMRRRPEYLDYLTGEVLAGPELEQRLPGLDARARALFGAEPEPPRPPPEPSPSYELLDRLGSGGMGEVHLARQLSLDRLVALKRLPERASEDAAALERFRREIKALARADHPNVVSVLDSGELHGRPFYAMEFVDGVTLSSLVGELSLDTNWQEVLLRVQGRRQRLMPTAETGGEAPDDRLPSPSGSASSRSASTERWLARLMRDAALGLHHLHELGVVHRDVKPDNLMLTARSGDVVVMDLGLAALEDASRSLSREQSQVVGTLRYLAPEQLRLRRERVDRRADVYSLGATFHELLSGHPLHDGDTEARLIEQIVSGPPRRLSRELPRLDRDLSTIVDTATSREPERRYPTAAALAADLDAWLEGRAISARAPTLAYVSSLWLRRHRAAATAVAVALVAGLLGTVSFVVNLEQARLEASAARDETAQRLVEATALARLAQSRAAGAAGSSTEALRRAWEAVELHETPATVQGLREALALPGFITELHPCEKGVWHAEFSPDGRTVLTVGSDFTARLWNLQGEELLRLGAEDQQVTAATFSPDGQRILVGSPNLLQEYSLTGVPAGPRAVVEDLVLRAAASPDGRLWAAGFYYIHVWPVGGGEVVRLEGHENDALLSLRFFPDGRRLLSVGGDGVAKIWNVATGDEVKLLMSGQFIRETRISSDGTLIATVSREGGAALWNVKGERMCEWPPGSPAEGLLNATNSVEFVQSARPSFEPAELPLRLTAIGGAFLGEEDCVQFGAVFYDAESTILGAEGNGAVSAADDGNDALFIAYADGSLAHWSGWPPEPPMAGPRIRGLAPGRFQVDLNAPGTHVLRHSPVGRVELVRLSRGAGASRQPPATGSRFTTLAVHGASGRIVVSTEDGVLLSRRPNEEGWNLIGQSATEVAAMLYLESLDQLIVASLDSLTAVSTEGLERRVLRLDGLPLAVAASEGSESIFVAHEDGRIMEWRLNAPVAMPVGRHEQPAFELVAPSDGSWLVTRHGWGELSVWNRVGDGWSEATQLDDEVGIVRHAESRSALFYSGPSGELRRWAMKTGERRELGTCGGGTPRMDLDDKAGVLATAGDDGSVMLWDLDSGRSVKVGSVEGFASSVRLSPEAKWVAAASSDGIVRVWSADGGPATASMAGADSRDYSNRPGLEPIVWSPDGRYLLVRLVTGELLELPVESGAVLECAQRFLPASRRDLSTGDVAGPASWGAW